MLINVLVLEFGKCYINLGIMEVEMVGFVVGFVIKGYKLYFYIFGFFVLRCVFD